jgi:hypothetical protein
MMEECSLPTLRRKGAFLTASWPSRLIVWAGTGRHTPTFDLARSRIGSGNDPDSMRPGADFDPSDSLLRAHSIDNEPPTVVIGDDSLVPGRRDAHVMR